MALIGTAMKKRTLVLGALFVLAAAGALAFTRGLWFPQGAVAQAPGGGPRAVPVEIARAEKKSMPLQVEALGTVTPIRFVGIKARLETMITEVHFADGAEVKEGDLLFTLDSRQIEAEIKRVEAVINGALAQLQQAERDVQRYTELVAKNATTVVTLNNAQTQVNMSRATAESNKATLENLRVQLDYTKIRAQFSGRISAANVKAGNFVRPSDTVPLATLIQMAPVYVTFTVPQRSLPDVRQAVAAERATVEAIIPGEQRRASGQVTMYDPAIDTATGMVAISSNHAEPGRTAVAGNIGHRANDVAQRSSGCRAIGRDPGQPDRKFRLRREGQRRERSAGEGGAQRGPRGGHRKRPGRWRDRGHRWSTIAEQRNARGAASGARAESRYLT